MYLFDWHKRLYVYIDKEIVVCECICVGSNILRGPTLNRANAT